MPLVVWHINFQSISYHNLFQLNLPTSAGVAAAMSTQPELTEVMKAREIKRRQRESDAPQIVLRDNLLLKILQALECQPSFLIILVFVYIMCGCKIQFTK
jgi:hypothetical protein